MLVVMVEMADIWRANGPFSGSMFYCIEIAAVEKY
jgi:hypothetical protein